MKTREGDGNYIYSKENDVTSKLLQTWENSFQIKPTSFNK